MWCLAGLTRSNGILYGGFFVYATLKTVVSGARFSKIVHRNEELYDGMMGVDEEYHGEHNLRVDYGIRVHRVPTLRVLTLLYRRHRAHKTVVSTIDTATVLIRSERILVSGGSNEVDRNGSN